MRWAPWIAIVGAVGCGAADREELVVFAASSLTESFEQLERDYERAHPDVDVRMVFAGSQVLRLQLEQGAAADVFASANEAHAAALHRAGLIATPEPLARNTLVVAVPLDNPAGIERFEQLDRAQRVVLGSGSVPVGQYADELLVRSGDALGKPFVADVRAHVVSREPNVRLVRAKVELGEADAAIVYRTDTAASSKVRVIEIPAPLSVEVPYVIAATTRSKHGKSFVDLARDPKGQAVLASHGFVEEVR